METFKALVWFTALCDDSIKLDKCALTTHYEHLARCQSWAPAMFDLACKQLSHVKCALLPTSEWVRVTLTLLDFDTKQHIPESPAAPDVYTESRNKNNYNQASAGCA